MSNHRTITAYPLAWPDGWPRTNPITRISRYQLKASFDTARSKLWAEIRRLGADGLVISCNLPANKAGDHRTDRADVQLEDPGVAIYFRLNDRPMSMATDRYQTPAANLRSVGLAVEYLRGLERHGGGHMMERAFAGFTALPPPAAGQAVPVDWRIELGPFVDGLTEIDLLVLCEARYRAKAKEAHPDAGGSNEAIIRLNAAIAQARDELAR